jgi:hypothetical protein
MISDMKTPERTFYPSARLSEQFFPIELDEFKTPRDFNDVSEEATTEVSPEKDVVKEF